MNIYRIPKNKNSFIPTSENAVSEHGIDIDEQKIVEPLFFISEFHRMAQSSKLKG